MIYFFKLGMNGKEDVDGIDRKMSTFP